MGRGGLGRLSALSSAGGTGLIAIMSRGDSDLRLLLSGPFCRLGGGPELLLVLPLCPLWWCGWCVFVVSPCWASKPGGRCVRISVCVTPAPPPPALSPPDLEESAAAALVLRSWARRSCARSSCARSSSCCRARSSASSCASCNSRSISSRSSCSWRFNFSRISRWDASNFSESISLMSPFSLPTSEDSISESDFNSSLDWKVIEIQVQTQLRHIAKITNLVLTIQK